MEVNEGLLAFFAEEEGAVGGVVHEEVFGEPAVAPAGGVAVDGDEDDVVLAEPAAPGIDAAAALGQGRQGPAGLFLRQEADDRQVMDASALGSNRQVQSEYRR